MSTTRISGIVGTGSTPNDKAARLYTHLVQREPRAWHAMRVIIQKAHAGDPHALEAWMKILAVHARQQKLGWGTGTPKQFAAAGRMYDKLQHGDMASWKDFALLMQKAEAGDLKAQQAWGILAQIHEQHLDQAHVSGEPAMLSEARKNQLISLAQIARRKVPGVAAKISYAHTYKPAAPTTPMLKAKPNLTALAAIAQRAAASPAPKRQVRIPI